MDGSLAYYRSAKAVWRDPYVPPLGLAGLAHARRLQGGAHGATLRPPIPGPDARRAHNLCGAQRLCRQEKALAEALGLDPKPFSEGWLLALFLAARWGVPETTVAEAARYVKTVLNLAVLEVPGPKAYAYSYYKLPEGPERDLHERYYRLYGVRGEGWSAAGSSSLARHIEAAKESLEPGRLYVV